jgi:hypothetical protein
MQEIRKKLNKILVQEKQMLNKELYHLHLENSKKCGKLWNMLDQNISSKTAILTLLLG